MFATERQEHIFVEIQKRGAVNIVRLAEELNVSTETIRRDLLAMEEKGKLLRVHGGAVARRDMKPFFQLQERNREYSHQKKELAMKAVEFVREGDVIAIDSGSTAAFFAEVLKEKHQHLTVVTNSADVFQILSEEPEIKLILVGGTYMPKERVFCGEIALGVLENLHVNKCFICPTGVSMEGGICDYQEDLIQIQKQMMRRADDVYILADSSKFEKKALLKLDEMRTKYRYITDSGLSQELQAFYQENGISVWIGGNQE